MSESSIKKIKQSEAELVKTIDNNHHEFICSVRCSNNGKYVATADRSCVFIYDVDNDYACQKVTSDVSCKIVSSIAFSPDSKVLATFEKEHKLCLYEVSGVNYAVCENKIFSIQDNVPENAEAIEFSPTTKNTSNHNNNLICVVSHRSENSATIYDLKTQTLKFQLDVNNNNNNNNNHAQSLAFHPCQDIVAISCNIFGLNAIAEIFIFELNNGTKIRTISTGPRRSILYRKNARYSWRVKFFDGGKKIAAINTEDKSIRFFDCETGSPIRNIYLEEDCLDFTFDYNEEIIVACTRKLKFFVKKRYFYVSDGAEITSSKILKNEKEPQECSSFSTELGKTTLFVDKSALVKHNILYFAIDKSLVVFRSCVLGNFFQSRKILFLCRWNGNEKSSFYVSMQVFNIFYTTCLYVPSHSREPSSSSSSSSCLIC